MSHDPRDEFAEAIQYGRMTPADAEVKLKELGLPPLVPDPNPADFGAMREVWWTLPMAIAWIAWRDPKGVARASEAFRKQCFYWEEQRWRDGEGGNVYNGFFLRWGGPATLLYLLTREAGHQTYGTTPSGAISIDVAKKLLWTALGMGALEAIGQSTAGGKPAPIADYEWRDLEIIQERTRDVVRRTAGGGYDDLGFRSQTIVAIWPFSRMDQRGLSLPDTMTPYAPGHMPLYCAAQWIATKGGTQSFEPTYSTIWQRAYSELLARISSNQVTVTGVKRGAREKLEGYVFASIAIDYPFMDSAIDLVFKDELHLQSYAYTDDESWRRGFDDCLRNRQGIQWSQLMVPREEIARWWPFDAEREPPQTHSGGPGRPSGMHLIETEYEARRKRGDAHGTLREVAADLARWGRVAHPTLKMPKARTIENALRAMHRSPTK